MADISSITLPGGGTYDLKDKNAVPKYGMGKNLLRNWYFVGGGTGRSVFPVNSRGATIITTGSTNFIDGWKTRGAQRGSVSLEANNLTITTESNVGSRFGILQYVNLKEFVGKAITLSVLTPDGIYSKTILSLPISSTAASVIAFSIDDGGSVALVTATSGCFVQITAAIGSTSLYNAIKLELGTEQTLCHNEGTDENPVWVLNDIPDYEYELYRCITSTADSSDTYANKSLATEQQLAYVETGTTASRAYAVGEYFCWNGLLYRVTAAISNGGTFTVGTNCEQVTVGAELNSLSNRFKAFTLTAGKSLQIYPRNNSARVNCLAASSGVRSTTAILYLLSLYSTNSAYHVINPIITGSYISVSTSDGTTTITNTHPSDTITIILLIFDIVGNINYTIV